MSTSNLTKNTVKNTKKEWENEKNKSKVNCPYCLHIVGYEVVLFKYEAQKEVGKPIAAYGDGYYKCAECGLGGPKHIINILEKMLDVEKRK